MTCPCVRLISSSCGHNEEAGDTREYFYQRWPKQTEGPTVKRSSLHSAGGGSGSRSRSPTLEEKTPHSTWRCSTVAAERLRFSRNLFNIKLELSSSAHWKESRALRNAGQTTGGFTDKKL